MRILTDCSFLSEKQIEKIAGKYNATYVFESQLKLRGGNLMNPLIFKRA